ncbi:hypothetical protein ACFSE1_09970 [Rhizobium helianthi]|uniref:Uncharacterized protein n=1 Tax=Rhizobium helianthi TaxID=1132695 RepID=A0ABW4M487_9HYPH
MDIVSAERLRKAAEGLSEDWLQNLGTMGLGGFAELRSGDALASAIGNVFQVVRENAVGNNVPPGQPAIETDQSVSVAPLTIMVTNFLQDTEVFPDITTWMAYAATLLAQEDFATTFSATGSHEERLTGHLLSSLLNSVDVTLDYASRCFQDQVFPDKMDFRSQQAEINEAILFHYADIAMGKQEKDTGADLGVVLCLFIEGIRCFRPFRLQAKKVNSEGRADIRHPKHNVWGQAEKLLNSRIGHYLFYFQRNSTNDRPLAVPSPIVQSVETILSTSEYASNVDTSINSLDLATFILREMCRLERDEHDYSTLDEAIGVLLENHDDPPSGVVAFGNVDTAFRLTRRLETAIDNIQRHVQPEPEPDYENDGPTYRPALIASKGLNR